MLAECIRSSWLWLEPARLFSAGFLVLAAELRAVPASLAAWLDPVHIVRLRRKKVQRSRAIIALKVLAIAAEFHDTTPNT